ncbi:dihydrodipicolinate synthase family protein [Asticcacaulis sp. BYS171W]|uniref:Dihydrodipicolinate synthase family protein n=1 Tax=Asticcacaulis aquaticus TaxID=2984212 RepID=A0ABT5HW39_9CAUL|nr:dihydrodipicolinate synthase family protein [Asticcacaulis aquaticus]
MAGAINGIVPVMLTPFTADDRIDYDGLSRLIEWYIANGADALFAVCLSSEMFFLSPQERRELGRFVVEAVRGRVPVLVSGHVSEDEEAQKADLRAAADSGADAVVLITNRIGEGAFLSQLDRLVQALPSDIDLGLYECPRPQRRLLSDAELQYCLDMDRFVILKDVSCDLSVVKRRLALAKGSRLAISNANAAIAFDAMKAGARGFCGIFANFAPDLYKWLLTHGERHPQVAAQVAPTLAVGSLCELFGYPALAKRYHQRLGTFASTHTRALGEDFDLYARCWAVEDVLDNIEASIETARAAIQSLKVPA